MKDEDLAAKLKLHYKQIRKYLNELKRDRLIKSEVRSEAVSATETNPLPHFRKAHFPATGLPEPRSCLMHPQQTTFEFYYIDYKGFVDTLKWKINAMNKMLDKEVRPRYASPPPPPSPN